MSVTFKNESLAKHRVLADQIKSSLQIDGRQIVEKESHAAYNANLPEGITPDTIKQISKYNGQFLKAATIAVGEMAAAEFKANKDVDELTATVGFQAPGDAYTFTVDRKRSFPVPHGKDEPENAPRRTVNKMLHIERTVQISGTSIKSVSSVMSEEFAGMFNA